MTKPQKHRFRAAAALVAVGAALLGASAPAAAQSLFASRGLGYVNPPVDGRALALGGVALGLPGGGLSLVNPAAIAAYPAPAISFAFQPDFYDSTLPGDAAEGSTARFPLLHAVFPFRTRWTFSAAFGSYLDQNWAVERTDTLRLPGRSVGFTDRFASRGGVTRLRLGTAYSVTERLSVGVAGDLYSGGARDTLSRRFERPDTVVPGRVDLLPAAFAGEWSYRGVGGSVGVRWVASDALNLGAAVTMGGTLEARPAQDSAGVPAGKEYALPLTFDVGASGRVAPRAVVALGAQWAGWSAADADLAE
ncbi:MAG TPA: hypothetical protein VGR37_10720, partial [Longimicrobiaceae bacterium]|nr:hypothetical protein [Longimicrobiaceae bacterium]